MNRILRWSLHVTAAIILSLAVSYCVSPAMGSGSPADAFGFAPDDYSLMGISDADFPFTGRKGCYPVGNGLVFAHLGVDGDFSVLRGTIGPGYQTHDEGGDPVYWADGEWPAIHANLRSGTQQLVWREQSIHRLRSMPMVKVEQRGDKARLASFTYAPPGEPMIIREFVLKAGEFQHPMKLSFQPALPDDGTQWMPDGAAKLAHGRKRVLVSLIGAIRAREEGGWWLPLLHPGNEIRFTMVLRFFRDGDEVPGVDTQNLSDLRERTIAWWREWCEGNIRFESPDAKLNDLMNELPMLIEVQRDAASGGVAPMVSYHGYWVRDSNGPILTLLANGKYDEVRQMLSYHRKVSWKARRVGMLFPLDEDVSDVTPGDDWSGIPLERAEVPSWVVLQHYWYWRYSGDIGLVREAMPFLKHNAFGLKLDEEYGVKFHGDETYAHGSLYSTYDREESGKIGYPNGYIPTDFFSFDNTLLHQEAALALEEMCNALGDVAGAKDARKLAEKLEGILERYRLPNGAHAPAVSDVTHESWYAPFSNINLRPYWLSLVSLREDAWKDYVWTRDLVAPESSGGTTPFSGYGTGHNLGYWLTAASALDSPEAGLLLNQLVGQSAPDGAWVEDYDPGGAPIAIYGRVNRIRPWESGINYEALLRYLSGLQLAPDGKWCLLPHLPSGWSSLKVKNLHADGRQFDLEVESRGEAPVRVAITVKGGEDVPPLTGQRRYEPIAQVPGTMVRLEPVAPTVPARTRLLVLTRDGSYGKAVKLDERLRKVPRSRTAVWDIAMPFTPADLRNALLDGESLRIPYLYLDSGVRDPGRRTFKDAGFWESAEILHLFEDYGSAGGQVIDSESLEIDPGSGVLQLRMLVVLYTNTFTWKMSRDDIANFHQEIAEWISWMDEVAGDRLQLELDYLQIDRWLPPLQSGPKGGGVYWMGWNDVADDLARRRVPRDHYDSFAVFWAWDRDVREDARQAYGGAAQGPGDDVKLLGGPNTMSYFGSAVLRSHPDNISKVALHEYLHNIDGMLTVAGHPERFFCADDMARHMELLLTECPGAFEEYGYSDSEMLELAAEEMKREASFPWRTQLVYYRWMLERTPPEHFLSVFPRLGRVEPRRRREALYERFILPEGTQPYQIAFDIATASRMKLIPVTLSDEDDDHVNLNRKAWTGVTTRAADVRAYAEAEITAPEKTEIALGDAAGELTVRVQKTGAADPAPVLGATVTARIGEQSLDFAETAEGVYAASISELPERETHMTVTASATGLIISPVVITVQASPSWTLNLPGELGCLMGEPKQLDFTIDDTSSDVRFDANAEVLPFKSDLTETLIADGFMQDAASEPIVESHGFGNRYTLALPALPSGTHTLNLTVTRVEGERRARYVHRYPVEATAGGAEFVVGRDGAGQTIGYLAREGEPLPALSCVIYDNGIFAGPLPLDDSGHYRVPSGPVAETIRLLRGGELPVRAEAMPPDAGALPKVPYYFLLARPLAEPPELDEVSANDPLLSLGFTPEHINALQGEYEGEDDASGRLGFGYDSEALHIWGVMKDDRMRSGGTWDSDRINFVFDALNDTTEWTYPEGAVGHHQWAADDYWVFANLFQDKPTVTRMGGEAPGGGIGYWGAVAGAKVSIAETDDGFKFVLSLQLSSLPHLSAEPGTSVGFTCFYSDWDDAFTELMFFTRWPVEAGGLVWTYWNPGVLYFAR